MATPATPVHKQLQEQQSGDGAWSPLVTAEGEDTSDTKSPEMTKPSDNENKDPEDVWSPLVSEDTGFEVRQSRRDVEFMSTLSETELRQLRQIDDIKAQAKQARQPKPSPAKKRLTRAQLMQDLAASPTFKRKFAKLAHKSTPSKSSAASSQFLSKLATTQDDKKPPSTHTTDGALADITQPTSLAANFGGKRRAVTRSSSSSQLLKRTKLSHNSTKATTKKSLKSTSVSRVTKPSPATHTTMQQRGLKRPSACLSGLRKPKATLSGAGAVKTPVSLFEQHMQKALANGDSAGSGSLIPESTPSKKAKLGKYDPKPRRRRSLNATDCTKATLR